MHQPVLVKSPLSSQGDSAIKSTAAEHEPEAAATVAQPAGSGSTKNVSIVTHPPLHPQDQPLGTAPAPADKPDATRVLTFRQGAVIEAAVNLLLRCNQSPSGTKAAAEPAVRKAIVPASALARIPAEQGSVAAHSIQPAQFAAVGDTSTPLRDPVLSRIQSEASLTQPSSSASAPASATPEAFATLDSAARPETPMWVHAGSHRAEAGFADPTLGWVGVRADSTIGQLPCDRGSGLRGRAPTTRRPSRGPAELLDGKPHPG